MKSKQGANAATPRLRFPEFQKSAPWPETDLGAVLFEHGEKDDGTSEVHSVSVHKGVVNQTEHLGRSFAAADRSKYNLVKPFDIVYTKSPTGDFPFGIVKQSRLPSNAIVSPLYGVFSPSNQYIGCLLDAYFESPNRTNRYLAPITQKGAKNTIQISNESFLSKGIFLPEQEDEQRKVAGCLTSLDEVIAAQGCKVERLKAHKRGLMQQLFPREGEPRPRTRFPEFGNSPDWFEKPASSVMSTVTPPRKIPTSGYQPEGLLAIVDQSPDPVCGWTDDLSARVTAPLPLIVFGDHTCVLKLIEHDFAQGADGIKIISAKTCIDIRFLFYALQVAPLVSTSYRRHFSLLQEKCVRFPKDADEQQRVADCLSSLDIDIRLEADHLGALKAHKQGLMQRLFPAPEAMGA